MTARMRRLASDYEQVKKDFAGHKNIIVTPVGEEPPEKYHIIYFVNGIYLKPDGQPEILSRHEVEITLHAEYPRYKPLCRILTPIWHPNFRDGQICIGDIWGAGESLSDIIVNIGNMIQYQSWNSYSPLCADAASWAIENKHLFPVGNINLNITDYASAKDTVDIDLFDDAPTVGPANEAPVLEDKPADGPEAPATGTQRRTQNSLDPNAPQASGQGSSQKTESGNDFEITAEELAGIEFVPSAQRMQVRSPSGGKGGVNLKTILVKGLLWALIGAIVGFLLGELTQGIHLSPSLARSAGHDALAEYFEVYNEAQDVFNEFYSRYEDYCAKEDLDPDDDESISEYLTNGASDEDIALLEEYYTLQEEYQELFVQSYEEDFGGDPYYDSDAEMEATLDEMTDTATDIAAQATRLETAIWSAVIALCIGLALGIGEGVFYGSAQKALIYAAIGAGVSIVLGFVSGYLAQYIYSEALSDNPADFEAALVRGIGWAIMGLGIGLAIGLIKPDGKRILFCCLGGLAGAFIGGFLFNYICDIIPDDMVARGSAITIMGVLIGLGVGLLEQFAKQAWLKVIRGEFEGKEYLVFAGVTSIGNTGKNTIVLFKDKLVGPHHCDIKQQGGRYVLIDCGTPMGTVVNGRRITQHNLRKGDTIAIGNSVLVFNTK